MHDKSLNIAAKIAAAQHARSKFRRTVTAFDPPASVERQSSDRKF
jgi:hypothetical protein